jgi:hypothetical protein
MTDFLGRIAGRALGTVPVARPVIPSTFAPQGAEPESGIGFVAESSVKKRQERDEAPRRLQGEPRRSEPVGIAREDSHERVRLEQSAKQSVAARRSETAQTETRFDETVAPLVQREQAVDQTKLIHEAAGEALRVRSESATNNRGAQVITPLAVAPRREAAAKAPLQAAPAVEQVIHVSIGRVEVRAEFPAPNARPAARRQQPPTLSLDEYMKQRSEGRR